ncbi:MAG: ion channel [Halofilum sp. (in: g-proteobacteria)]|nr:ion channel [Halofilum sp. (in: g-proteobacteria)]
MASQPDAGGRARSAAPDRGRIRDSPGSRADDPSAAKTAPAAGDHGGDGAAQARRRRRSPRRRACCSTSSRCTAGSSRWSFFDAFWLTFTTITTVGYGDLSAATPGGRLVTVVLMYSLGIFLLANLAGYWIDYRAERRDKMLRGRWSWNMKDHILILNVPTTHPGAFLRRLVEEIKHWRGPADVPIQVVTEAFPDGLPEPLRELGVVHQHGDPDDPEVLANADVARAAHILLLTTSETDPRADSITLSVMERLRAGHARAPGGRMRGAAQP